MDISLGVTTMSSMPRKPRAARTEDTRARLVDAAARAFNRGGYHGTDTNRIARAAGYAPATFYKHFADKRAIFLAAYERWVATEWDAIGEALAAGGSTDAIAARVVDLVLEHHRRWRGLRASLLARVVVDAEVRRFYRAQRRRQLGLLAGLGSGERATPRSRAEDAILIFTLERTCDAIANGERRDLGLDVEPVLEAIRARVRARLGR